MSRVYREAYDMFIACGILFNHESEVRGPEFVTRKIAMEVARIARELSSDPRSVPRPLLLGNLDARKDWGYAPDYVDAMWRMLQIDRPDDFVIGTGEQHTVREFATEAFRAAGMGIAWRTGADGLEEGVDKDGRVLVRVDPSLYRPHTTNIAERKLFMKS
ncbi:MAG: GDP-mannose 4,6-dehydratase, partial [Conexivisphaera sp.]